MLIRAKAVNMEILMKTLSPPRNSVYWKADNLEKFIGKILAPVFSLYEITSFVIKKKIENFGPVMGPLQHQQICSPLPTRFETRCTLSEFRKYSNHYRAIYLLFQKKPTICICTQNYLRSSNFQYSEFLKSFLKVPLHFSYSLAVPS